MPFIRVNSPANALTAEQKAKLAPLLVEALISQEIDPVTEIGRAATALMFNEIEEHNCFPGVFPSLSIRKKVLDRRGGSNGFFLQSVSARCDANGSR